MIEIKIPYHKTHLTLREKEENIAGILRHKENDALKLAREMTRADAKLVVIPDGVGVIVKNNIQ